MASTEEDQTVATASPPRKRHITDLPLEIQKSIFKHSPSSDLIALALVSRHFHSVACAQLYRIFSIVFPDEDDPAFETPIDGLAGGLDTMVTSDHDYTRYLKEISLDSLSGGEPGEGSYRPYSYSESCGKFMNTLLLLCMRRAKALETFRWNIRVELSRPLFKALHDIPTLKRLHVRLQAGPSLYLAPPPLPSSAPTTHDGHVPTPLSIFSSFAVSPSPPPPYSSKSGPSTKPTPPRKPEPPTFSGFKSLNSLAVLDMDSLDYLPEIATCIRSSSSTLKKLKLSLSESLAIKARKPVVEDSDDSDQDIDEFGNTLPQPPTLPPALPSEGPQEKEAKIRAERTNQEAVLGRIFGLEKLPVEVKKEAEKSESQENSSSGQAESVEKAGLEFFDSLRNATKKFLDATPELDYQAPNLDIDALKLIKKAAEKFVSAEKVKGLKLAKKLPKKSEVSAGPIEHLESSDVKDSMAESFEKVEPVADKGKGKEKAKDSTQDVGSSNGNAVLPLPPQGLFDTPTPRPAATSAVLGNEEGDVDIDHPDVLEVDEGDDQEMVDEDANPILELRDALDQVSAKVENAKEAGAAQEIVASSSTQIPPPLLSETTGEAKHTSTNPSSTARTDEKATMSGGLNDANAQTPLSKAKPVEDDLPQDEAMKNYIRSTRKLPLQTLALYLVPIKASILSRAVDLSLLRRITLLNVGPQAPFWTLMANTHKFHPLNLRCISTDNVTPKFVSLVNSLPRLTELFLLERSSKTRVESLAGRTMVTIVDIRKQILKPHAKTLKKLMIKNENENDYSWDVDVKTMRLMTKRSEALTELAISMGLRSFHLLLQYLPGLSSLRVLHIISFRTDDICPWVMRELRKFAIDNVAHHPHLKLEYIGLDCTVERLLRRPKETKKKKAQAEAKKDPEPTTTASPEVKSEGVAEAKESAGPSTAPTSSAAEAKDAGESEQPASSSEDSDDDDDDRSRPLLKIETLENVKFYDVYGVRIFRKDVMAGRL